MKKGALSHLAETGELSVRVTPGASAESVAETDAGLAIRVTAPPADGQANKAVQKLLARALGLPKSRLTLVRGHSARDKTFRIEP
ncbi:DUF167 domain-containing protein [Roseicyclus sp. F158]|uniref:UPF0235 protein RM543_06995 n=1 Tax=Tropicimonas omnivorans TaxID=3075590 RepID=A0ABU3DFU2_9RHOB|nr:DUF167 domain-containing protein [Roseicyclus sp. F158]MDT0682423.1 DUF167 domain-containing protein [Roseicyclus sp. F158]